MRSERPRPLLRILWLLLAAAPLACTALLGDFTVGDVAVGSDATADGPSSDSFTASESVAKDGPVGYSERNTENEVPGDCHQRDGQAGPAVMCTDNGDRRADNRPR